MCKATSVCKGRVWDKMATSFILFFFHSTVCVLKAVFTLLFRSMLQIDCVLTFYSVNLQPDLASKAVVIDRLHISTMTISRSLCGIRRSLQQSFTHLMLFVLCLVIYVYDQTQFACRKAIVLNCNSFTVALCAAGSVSEYRWFETSRPPRVPVILKALLSDIYILLQNSFGSNSSLFG